jgi:hypothetical protein
VDHLANEGPGIVFDTNAEVGACLKSSFQDVRPCVLSSQKGQSCGSVASDSGSPSAEASEWSSKSALDATIEHVAERCRSASGLEGGADHSFGGIVSRVEETEGSKAQGAADRPYVVDSRLERLDGLRLVKVAGKRFTLPDGKSILGQYDGRDLSSDCTRRESIREGPGRT